MASHCLDCTLDISVAIWCFNPLKDSERMPTSTLSLALPMPSKFFPSSQISWAIITRIRGKWRIGFRKPVPSAPANSTLQCVLLVTVIESSNWTRQADPPTYLWSNFIHSVYFFVNSVNLLSGSFYKNKLVLKSYHTFNCFTSQILNSMIKSNNIAAGATGNLQRFAFHSVRN